MDDSDFDVFVAHHANDANAAALFANALSATGLTVRSSGRAGSDDTSQRPNFTHAKFVVVWLSADHCVDTPLQREFMQAYAASLRDPPRDRMLIVDALKSETSLPSVLRSTCQIIQPNHLHECVEHIATHVRRLAGPMHARAADIQSAPRDFVGRLGLLWQLHESLFASDSPVRHTTQLIGDAGSGKTWLAEEYAQLFAAAFPGGVFRLDAGWFERPSSTQFHQMRVHAWREIGLTLGADVDAADEYEIASDVRERLESRNMPYLWIVDHVPPGQTLDNVRAWFAPTATGATILVSRTAEYAPAAPHLTVASFTRDEACALFAQHKPMATEPEVIAGRQLFEQLGGHPLAVHLAATRLARSTYDRMLLQLAAPAREAAQVADGLAPSLQHPQLVGIAVSIQRTFARLSPQGRHALRLASVLAPAPVPLALLTTALAQHSRGSSHPQTSVSQTQIAFDELFGFKLAQRGPDTLLLTPLVREAVLAGDHRNDIEAARQLLIAILAGELPQATGDTRANPYWSWVPHVLHLIGAVAPSPQVMELNAWLSRFDGVLGVLRTNDRRAVKLLEDGDVAQAQALLDMELAARRMGLGEHHPQTVTPANNLGVALSLRGDFARARVLFEEAIDVRRKTLGDSHRDLLTPLNNLGVVFWHEGDHAKARRVFEKVVELRKEILGDRHPETLVSMRNLAVALRRDGEFVAARSLLEHVVECRRASLGNQHVDTCTAMASLAETLREHSEAILSRISETLSIDSPLLGHESGVRVARA